MGGVLIIISIVIPTLLWADLRYPYVWIALAALLGYGWIGFLDDYAKVTQAAQPGPDRPRASWSTSSSWGSRSPPCCWSCAPTATSPPP